LPAERHASSRAYQSGRRRRRPGATQVSPPAPEGQAGEGTRVFAVWGETTTLNLYAASGPSAVSPSADNAS